MDKSRRFFPMLIPSATVFLSSACVMIIELVAGRLIARHLGSSLYTWTSVIGVVLAGITIGNYIGGRSADRYDARKSLAVLFALSSVACVITVILNNLVGEWIFLWKLNWPIRIFTHVSLVFLLPSTILGTISPVVAKMALDKGLATGKTIGTIYAWGAAGSIAGTFLAGFYLIAAMGTIAIIWTVGGILLVMALLYWSRQWILYLWAVIFASAFSMGMIPAAWTKTTAAYLALREKPNPKILYEDETQYCYVAVRQVSMTPDKRVFMQDKLKHSEVIMGDINRLQYFHTVIFAAITHGLADQKTLSVMHIGGGGYVFPQYIEKNWPGSRNDVAEIDPGITKAATEAFGLKKDTTINTITLDARNYVDQLLQAKRNGREIPSYDFIYEDAFSDYSVPCQLVTKEFNDKIFKILTDDGIYMINSIDTYESCRFLGSYIHTLEQTFPHVYTVTEPGPASIRRIFVLIASKKKIDPENLIRQHRKDLDFWCLNDSETKTAKQRSGNILMTDDYVPVENLLSPVVLRSGKDMLTGKFLADAKDLKAEGKFDESIAKYNDIVKTDPPMSVLSYNEMAMMRAQQGRLAEAAEMFRKAIEYHQTTDDRLNIAKIHFNLGLVSKKLGQMQQAEEQLQMAVQEFRKDLDKKPDSTETLVSLGNTFAEMGDFKSAAETFHKACEADPYDIQNHTLLAQALAIQGRIDEAVDGLQKAAAFMTSAGRKDAAAQLQKYIEYFQAQKQQPK